MPSTFTKSLQLEKQAFNENSNSWGARDNATFDKVDSAIGGFLTKDLTGLLSPYSLTFIQGTADETTNATIVFVGTIISNFIIVLPPSSRQIVISNQTSGGFSLVIECLSGSNTFTLPNGLTTAIKTDGNAISDLVNYISGSLQVGGNVSAQQFTSSQGTLPIASGGTGAQDVNGAYANLTPPGVIHLFAAAAPPNGWLLCNGSAVSRTTFSALFGAIGSTYGGGDGVTTFSIPDLRGRVVVCAGQGTNLSNRGISQVGGEESHTQSLNEIVAHNHASTGMTIGPEDTQHTHSGTTGFESIAHTHTFSTVISGSGQIGSGNAFTQSVGTTAAESANHTHSLTTSSESAQHAHVLSGNTANAGGGAAFNVMQPFIVLNYIIKV